MAFLCLLVILFLFTLNEEPLHASIKKTLVLMFSFSMQLRTK